MIVHKKCNYRTSNLLPKFMFYRDALTVEMIVISTSNSSIVSSEMVEEMTLWHILLWTRYVLLDFILINSCSVWDQSGFMVLPAYIKIKLNECVQRYSFSLFPLTLCLSVLQTIASLWSLFYRREVTSIILTLICLC